MYNNLFRKKSTLKAQRSESQKLVPASRQPDPGRLVYSFNQMTGPSPMLTVQRQEVVSSGRSRIVSIVPTRNHARCIEPVVYLAGTQVIQRAQWQNVPASFQTSFGSQYTVTQEGLERQRYYGGVSSSAKNVYYGDEKTTDECKRARERCDTYKVEPGPGFGQVTIKFRYKGKLIYSAVLQQTPSPGLYPVDMILTENFKGAEEDRFHIGDRITGFN